MCLFLRLSSETFSHFPWARLKYDRGHPCDTCVKRGLSLSCTFVNPSDTSTSSGKGQPRPSAYLKLQERIGQLENLVASQLKELDEGTAESSHAGECPPSLLNPTANRESWSHASLSRIRRISVEDAGTTWVGSDHWTAILDGISELKDSFECVPSSNEDDTLGVLDPLGPELLLGQRNKTENQDVLAAIPLDLSLID